jgi:hypothetical protein
MKYARAKLNIELKSRYSSCTSNSNLVIKEANSIIETIDNDSIFDIINWEINLLDFLYVTISLETKSYKNSWKELKDIKERVKNINSILFDKEEIFLIDNLNFTIGSFLDEDPEKSIEEVISDIPEQTLQNMDIHPIIKKGISAIKEEYNPKDHCVEYDITKMKGAFEVSSPKEERKNIASSVSSSPGNFIPITNEQMEALLPQKEKKKSLKELILAFLKKKGPSSVKEITLGVLNMGLVTKSKSPRMLVNSMLWKLYRDERYRQKDKTGAYYNPVRLDGDRWMLNS